MDRATAIDVGSANSIGYMDSSGNGGGAGGLTNTDTLVGKSKRCVLELTPKTGCAADVAAGDTTRIAKRDEPELNASSCICSARIRPGRK